MKFSFVFTIGLFSTAFFIFRIFFLLGRRVNQEHYTLQECVGDTVSKLVCRFDSNDSKHSEPSKSSKDSKGSNMRSFESYRERPSRELSQAPPHS